MKEWLRILERNIFELNFLYFRNASLSSKSLAWLSVDDADDTGKGNSRIKKVSEMARKAIDIEI